MNCQVDCKSVVPKEIDREKIALLLKQVNKPGRYIGSEYGSANKDFGRATVTTVLAFPDLYEIGISNLGLKILYNAINSHPNFMADRTYAPDKDFKDLLSKNDTGLYGLETFVSISSFDIIAFSLQYELNYTTMLGMLELANIPLLAKDRTDNHPVVIAGGPSCFNPEPFADFVDAVLSGDGEDIVIDVLNCIESFKTKGNSKRSDILEALSKIEGVYVPSLYKTEENSSRPVPVNASFPRQIRKRHSDLTNEMHPEVSPIPNVSAIHDRSVVEIRRGCARMCRFCQSCYVNLPVRERSHKDVQDLCFKTLDRSGYDEISLLSLSSSDYKNLEALALELNYELAQKEISISLPSQRADNFNLELARQLQTVRKSTLTFAPEAGSERLRKVINKNLDQDQIIEAIMSAYQAGWNKIKLYFIIGLPTETYEDLDGIINLIKLIKSEADKLKQVDKKINRSLEITCTLSIFVPKPFTPFQWIGQLSSEEIKNRKDYLLSAARNIKRVKLNFHDLFCSKLECLFSRGNRNLSHLILNAYNNGAYLDSWSDYFSKRIWETSATNSGVDIEKLTTKEFNTDEDLSWEIIDIGINKDWLKEETKLALEGKNTIPCEDHCTNCGVCVNLNVSPKYESRKETKKFQFEIQTKRNYTQKFKYRIKLTKESNLKYISHLDWFRMIYRAIKRAHLPVAFSQGYNPAPKISIGIPLGLFIESISEFMDIELFEELDEKYIKTQLNNVLPDNCMILDVKIIDKKEDSISKIAKWAEYEAKPELQLYENFDFNHITNEINSLLSGETIIITKKTKSKIRELDIKPLVKSVNVVNSKPERILFTLSCAPESNIKPEEFLNTFSNSKDWSIKRINLYDKDLKSL